MVLVGQAMLRASECGRALREAWLQDGALVAVRSDSPALRGVGNLPS